MLAGEKRNQANIVKMNVINVIALPKVRIAPSRDHISVDYDATRMTRDDVSNVMVRFGVPIVTSHP